MKDREYLVNFYNATSTTDESGELETYEHWLERQLISRIEIIEEKGLPNVTGRAIDFEVALYRLINAYCANGLRKPDLLDKMEYVTKSCELS